MVNRDTVLMDVGADSISLPVTEGGGGSLQTIERQKSGNKWLSPLNIALIILFVLGIATIFLILYFGTSVFDKEKGTPEGGVLQSTNGRDLNNAMNPDRPPSWNNGFPVTTTTSQPTTRRSSTRTTRRRLPFSRTTGTTTTTTLPRSSQPICTTNDEFFAAFKLKCSLVLAGTLPESQGARCSLLSDVVHCTRKQLLPLNCSLENIRQQLSRLTVPNNRPSLELKRAQRLHFQCPEDLNSITRPTGIVARPTTRPLCLISDEQIITAFYVPECMALLYRTANSTAAKCRNLYALASCMAKEYQRESPECTYHAAYHLLSYPDNELYFTQNFKFKPANCPAPTEELPPLPGPTCDLKRGDIKKILQKRCMKPLEEASEHTAPFCRRYETTMRCISNYIRSMNKTCEEQFIRQTAAEKDITHAIFLATGFTIKDCDGPGKPTCDASLEDIVHLYKFECFSILHDLHKSLNDDGVTLSQEPTERQCSAMKQVYECISFTLLRDRKKCGVAAVKWYMEGRSLSSLVKGTFGFEPLQCNIDFVPAPTASPRCTATDEDIIAALYDGCFDELYNHNGTIAAKCYQYKVFATCTVAQLVKRNHTHCGLDPVRYLIEHPNNHGYFLSEFGYLPSKNCTFIWPTDPSPTDGFVGNDNQDNWDLPDQSVLPCASKENTLAHVLDGCTTELIEQEAYHDRRQERLCWGWFRLADCVSDGFKKSGMVCSISRVHASLLQDGVLSMFTVSFNFDPRACFGVVKSTAPSVIGQG